MTVANRLDLYVFILAKETVEAASIKASRPSLKNLQWNETHHLIQVNGLEAKVLHDAVFIVPGS